MFDTNCWFPEAHINISVPLIKQWINSIINGADFKVKDGKDSRFNWKGKFADFREGDVQNPLIDYLLIEFKKVHFH